MGFSSETAAPRQICGANSNRYCDAQSSVYLMILSLSFYLFLDKQYDSSLNILG